jgi:hypothetical protein
MMIVTNSMQNNKNGYHVLPLSKSEKLRLINQNVYVT